ncbi:asparagine synthase (glutamine-hydrolyzing) [Solirubrobacter sp. CPCC 204708]|nr:asparagine synthase (glutamine-hydrolyzing) [Solirubrobacter deserti]
MGGEAREVISPEVLNQMTDAMTHRGPNDRGIMQAPGVAFGARRLSIVDVEAGHQPFPNETGDIWGMQNGELYNHAEITRQLKAEGHVLRTRCDTEILPHLYERYGTHVPEQLRGKFAIAIWDGTRRRAVIARDRLGVKPLYWAQVGDRVIFASELKSLLASGLIGPDLDYEAIDSYLTFGFFSGPRTPLAGVSKLMPGHRLVIDESGVSVERYWAYPRPEAQPGLTVDDWGEGLIAELEDAVKSRLMADVPLGAMLSGGLDSSVIVALMARNMSEPVKTFSVGFAEDGKKNELSDAKLVADSIGAEHHELQLSVSDAAVDLETLSWQIDEPLADLSSLGFSALSELAAKHVTVTLSGQGADELLGGYNKHQAAAAAAAFSRLPAPARAAITSAARRGPGKVQRMARTLEAPGSVDRLLAMSGKLDDDLRGRLLRGPLAELDGDAARRVVAERLGDIADEPLAATLYIDGQLALVDDMLHYFDRASMAHSLEVRVPFLDHKMVEYCATIPTAMKVRRVTTTKHVLKHAARGIIPDRIIDKQKIGFFAGSVDRWFAAQAGGGISDFLLTPSPRYAEFLDRGTVASLVRRHADGTDTRNGRLLLAIVMLEVWLSSTLPRAIPSAGGAPLTLDTKPVPSEPELSYAVVTPVRDEAENLPRLAASLASQTVTPTQWVVVDTGSTDDTCSLTRTLATEHPWITLVEAPEIARTVERGAPIVRGFERGVAALAGRDEVVVKVDADVSFEPDHFQRLLSAFAEDRSLGIAGGNAVELEDGQWVARYNTGSSVWGADRAYRRECLDDVMPLERSMGWDGIDELKAHLRGWHTRTLVNLPFKHHRGEGERDGHRLKPWTARGRAAHYMGYRGWFLTLRALHHTRSEPAALAMIWGYAAAALKRQPVCSDAEVRAELRRSQSVRSLRARRRRAIGAATS